MKIRNVAFGWIFLSAAVLFVSALSTGCTYRNRQGLMAGNCDTSSVTYTNTVAGIMNNYCTNCHGGSSPSAGISLEGYVNVKAMVVNGQLWGTMNHDPGYKAMPQGTPKLDPCTLQKLLNWIQQGAPNN